MRSMWLCLLPLLLCTSFEPCRADPPPPPPPPSYLGWRSSPPSASSGSSLCTLARVDASTPEGVRRFWNAHVKGERPAVLINARSGPKSERYTRSFDEFLRRIERNAMLKEHGQAVITLSTANSYSHDKRKVTLEEYIKQALDHAAEKRVNGTHTGRAEELRGNETYLWFGDHDDASDGRRLRKMIDTYEHSMPEAMQIPGTTFKRDVALSFGIGGVGTGVPWHTHGAGFSECFSGRKRWFFQPPDDPPVWDPDATTAQWLATATAQKHSRWMECVLHPGEIVYFPSEWHHATLNLDEVTHISAFVNGGWAATSAKATAARERGLRIMASRRAAAGQEL